MLDTPRGSRQMRPVAATSRNRPLTTIPTDLAEKPADEGPIAIVSHSHPSISKGGAEIAAYSLYQGLLALGVNAIFIAVCPVTEQHRLLLASDTEHALIADTQRYDHFYQLASDSVWQQLKAVLLKRRVRLVNFHHFLAVGVNSLRGLSAETSIPFVVTLHEFLAICTHHGQMVTRPARRLCHMASPTACAACYPENTRQQFASRQRLIQGALSAAAGFVSPSQFLAERMVEWGLPHNKFVVIENGLRHVPDKLEVTRPSNDTRLWTFGYFGQITPFKGVDVLLDAIDLLALQPELGRRLRIRIHGNLMGQSVEFIERFNKVMARSSAIVSYAGPYDNRDVPDLMGACDYVVVPSTWWENSPVVIQEAYAAGRPVICTGIGGMAEKVPNRRSGLHFRINDPTDLARVMAEASDAVLYQALSSGLPAVATQATMAQSYLAAFTRLSAAQQDGGQETSRPQRRRLKASATA